MRFWKLSRRFLDNLVEQLSTKRIKAVCHWHSFISPFPNPLLSVVQLFPDMGVSVMLENLWSDANFDIGCLNSRSIVVAENEVVVVVAPDPPGFEDCRRIIAEMSEDGYVVLFNPRFLRSLSPCHRSPENGRCLCSGDVGVGLNVRRMRDMFSNQFVTVYSLRPIGDIGSVFRKFPDPWFVFIADEAAPGRYKKIAERSSRLSGLLATR